MTEPEPEVVEISVAVNVPTVTVEVAAAHVRCGSTVVTVHQIRAGGPRWCSFRGEQAGTGLIGNGPIDETMADTYDGALRLAKAWVRQYELASLMRADLASHLALQEAP